MIKRISTAILTGSIQLLNAVAYLLGLTAAGFGIGAGFLDRVRTRISEYSSSNVDYDDPYDDIHNADDPNITKNYKNNE